VNEMTVGEMRFPIKAEIQRTRLDFKVMIEVEIDRQSQDPGSS